MYNELTLDALRRHRPDLVDALFAQIEEVHQECRSLPQVLVNGPFVRQLLEAPPRERKRLVANRRRLLNGRDAPRQMDDEVLGVGAAAAGDRQMADLLGVGSAGAGADRDRTRTPFDELLAV